MRVRISQYLLSWGLMMVDFLILYSLLHISFSLFVTFSPEGVSKDRLSLFGCNYKSLLALFRQPPSKS